MCHPLSPLIPGVQADLVSEDQLEEVETFLKKVNQRAEVITTTRSRLSPELLLGKARFDLRKAEEHPEWLKEARAHEHTPRDPRCCLLPPPTDPLHHALVGARA